MLDMMLWWLSMTPFGSPVLPEEKITVATHPTYRMPALGFIGTSTAIDMRLVEGDKVSFDTEVGVKETDDSPGFVGVRGAPR